MTNPATQKYKHRLPFGANKLQKKLEGFIKRITGERMQRFQATGRTTLEYETESGKKGIVELYQGATKKWQFRELNGE